MVAHLKDQYQATTIIATGHSLGGETRVAGYYVQPSSLDRAIENARDVRPPTFQRLVIAFDQHHRQPRVTECHGDARAHRATADDTHRADRSRLDVGEFGRLRRRTLGEEHVPKRLRLLARAEFEEGLAFLREGVLRCVLDGSAHALSARSGESWPRARRDRGVLRSPEFLPGRPDR